MSATVPDTVGKRLRMGSGTCGDDFFQGHGGMKMGLVVRHGEAAGWFCRASAAKEGLVARPRAPYDKEDKGLPAAPAFRLGALAGGEVVPEGRVRGMRTCGGLLVRNYGRRPWSRYKRGRSGRRPASTRACVAALRARGPFLQVKDEVGNRAR